MCILVLEYAIRDYFLEAHELMLGYGLAHSGQAITVRPTANPSILICDCILAGEAGRPVGCMLFGVMSTLYSYQQ